MSMSAEKGNGQNALPPVKAEKPMPSHLVRKGYLAGSYPEILIQGSGRRAYSFLLHAQRAPGVAPEQAADLIVTGRGATGSSGYVQRQAQILLREIFERCEQSERRTA